MITMKEAAKIAGVHENTARFYRDQYEEYFPCEGEGRNRRYSLETAEVIRKIKDCYDEGLGGDEIRKVLDEHFGVPVVTTTTTLQQRQPQDPGVNIALIQSVVMQATSEAVKEIIGQVQMMAERQAEQHKKDMAELSRVHNNEIVRLRQEIQEANQDFERSKSRFCYSV